MCGIRKDIGGHQRGAVPEARPAKILDSFLANGCGRLGVYMANSINGNELERQLATQ